MEKKNIKEKHNIIVCNYNAPKDKFNRFGNYSYRSAEGITVGVKPWLTKTKTTIVMQSEIVEVGGRVYIKATATLVDLESDDSISAVAYAREAENKKGMDDSQITGSTHSYAIKYALGNLLLCGDEQDADALNKHGKESYTKIKPTTEDII